MMIMTSSISKFYEKNLDERLKIVQEFANLDLEEISSLKKYAALDFDTANRMIENVIGTTQLPVGIATNFIINGKEVLVPMALEEPSVVAAASKAAGNARASGGFQVKADEPVMIGQIQLINLKDLNLAARSINEKKKEILDLANSKDPTLVSFGGGAKDLETRILTHNGKQMLVVHIYVDVRDAMGANAVNTMAEAIAPMLEEMSGGKVCLRILSNLATRRLVKAKAVWKKDEIGEDAVEGVINAYSLAAADPYRAATHNKGIMNGIDAVVIATGNDWRAVEAGAHAYASLDGRYKPLTKYYKDRNGDLVGEIELPMAVGLVGGATKTHPIAKIAVKILGVKTSKELAEIIAAVGLAQNFAALRALSTEGIQKGHMKLHSRNIAVMAGATGDEIDAVAKIMSDEKQVNVVRAKEVLEELRAKKQ
jgi:hydroxymethylglutaryl-CoA reductase